MKEVYLEALTKLHVIVPLNMDRANKKAGERVDLLLSLN
jgi:hypothetical protein